MWMARNWNLCWNLPAQCCTGATTRRPNSPKAFGSIPEKGHCWPLLRRSLLLPTSDQPVTGCAPLVVTAGHILREAIARDAGIAVSDHRLAYSPDAAAGSSLNGTGRMSVGVAVKPPDESFHGLETTPPDYPLLRYHTDPDPRVPGSRRPLSRTLNIDRATWFLPICKWHEHRGSVIPARLGRHLVDGLIVPRLKALHFTDLRFYRRGPDQTITDSCSD